MNGRPSALRRHAIGIGVAVALAALLLSAWLSRHRFLPVEVGMRAPEFSALNLQGDPVSLADHRGEVILLNIWATWCLPCREEMPSMQRLHERLGAEGFRVIAVSVDALPGGRDPTPVVASFVEEYGLDFDIWLDPAGGVQRTYRTTGVPETFVIDREGMIVKKVIGATEWDSEANVELFHRLLQR
jgi:cytochrome c biogenesis protein CcmG, thiol:disulfide interchange protein DsbE